MLVYEVGFGTQFTNDDGELIILNFDRALDLLEHKIYEIVEETWADEEPTLYLTGDKKIGDGPQNFRVELCKSTVYKGTRHAAKPFHYDNLRVYMIHHMDAVIAWGMEADDLMCIDHRKDPDNTMICSRDKDLRMCEGTHYGWPCGKQLGFGPKLIDELGYLSLNGKGKLSGGGLKFFYSQMITGDTVDNIPGIRGKGPAAAFKLLNECESEAELHKVVAELYETKVGEGWRDYFKEQAALLWMVRELNEDGSLKHFVMWDERDA